MLFRIQFLLRPRIMALQEASAISEGGVTDTIKNLLLLGKGFGKRICVL